MRRSLFLLIVGALGTAVLVGLGTWQIQRLHWKQAMLSDIEARIHKTPVSLPAKPVPERDRYLAVEVEGRFAGPAIRVLVSQPGAGPGYRIVQRFDVDSRRIMVDRGFVPVDESFETPNGRERIDGNLDWPRERDGFTPDPDLKENLWFARDVEEMARRLGTEPVLVVQRTSASVPGYPIPMPVDSRGIPNDHLNYAITWFLLAAIWAGMTGWFLWRTRRPVEGCSA